MCNLNKSATPSTTTHTSLKGRPVLRIVLQALWVVTLAYVAYVVANGATNYTKGWFVNANILQQITRLGFNLLTLSTIDIFSDIYILLGYIGLAVVLFLQRSDDWFAIFLSIVIMTFGLSVTNIGNELATYPLSVPAMIIGDAGIVMIGWFFPDGYFFPRWLKYATPFLLASMAALYLPGSPVYAESQNLTVYFIVSSFWYFSSAAMMIYRYKTVPNPNQKQQIRWVFTGMMGPLAWFLLFFIPAMIFPSLRSETSLASVAFFIAIRILGIGLLLVFPACLTIAIARYKLFDIDLLINRALVYGALTVVLASVFALVLIVDTAVLNALTSGGHTTVGLTISAIAAGALFQPARKSLQRFVDRSFYHINIDYLKTPPALRGKGKMGDTFTQASMLFSDYRNMTLIGRGGMAEVYHAYQPSQHRDVAIKVLPADLAEDEQFRKRFQREAQALAGLEHPNIVKIFDYGTENNLYYMVMEYLNGDNLSDLLKKKSRLGTEETLPILRNVADALDYAHSLGFVHRDVKPSNVILDGSLVSPRAVLTDFGIAKLSTGAYSNITASAVLGTFDYIAPEQIQGAADVDGRADIYALGVMAYQLLTGVPPFKRATTGALLLAHMTAPPPDARQTAPALSRETAQALQKAMAKEPNERFATAREFAMSLE